MTIYLDDTPLADDVPAADAAGHHQRPTTAPTTLASIPAPTPPT